MNIQQYAVSTEHPEYSKRKELWEKIEDCIEGEDRIKSLKSKYLPRPSGMQTDTEGEMAYTSYLERAHFPAFTDKLLSALTGITKINPPKIELPKSLDYLRENCDGEGTPLDIFFFQSVREALKSGRQILFPDIDVVNNRPMLIRYYAKDIINWGVVNRVFNNKDVDFFVLKEYVQDSDDFFVHDYKEQYRVLTTKNIFDKETNSKDFTSIIFDENGSIVPELVSVPTLMGKPFEGFPVTIVGSTDLHINPDSIPLLGVASCSLQMYMKDADLSNSMFITCNPTLVIAGIKQDAGETFFTLVGSNVAITLDDPSARVFYPTTDSSALAEVRLAIQMYLAEAQSMGAALLSNSRNVESEGALRIKAASTTASLSTVSQTVARGLEATVRNIAKWMNLDETEVNVKVDSNYLDNMISNDDVASIIKLYMSDIITHYTALDKLKEGNYVMEGFDVNEEIKEIEKKKKESQDKIDAQIAQDALNKNEDSIVESNIDDSENL